MSDLVEAAETNLPAKPDPTGTLVAILNDPAKLEAFPLDKLERLIELQDRMNAETARQEFNRAFAAVQSELTPVAKRGYNSHTRAHYVLADDVTRMLNPILDRHGFSRSLATKVGDQAPGLPDGHTRFVLILRHDGGHTEEYSIDAPIDAGGTKGRTNKTAVQGLGSTYTYMQRYLLLNVFGIPVGADDDGRGGNVGPVSEKISAEEVRDLNTRMVDLGVDFERFLDYFGIRELSELTREQSRRAGAMLDQRESQQ